MVFTIKKIYTKLALLFNNSNNNRFTALCPKSLYLTTPLAFNPADGGVPYIISL